MGRFSSPRGAATMAGPSRGDAIVEPRGERVHNLRGHRRAASVDYRGAMNPSQSLPVGTLLRDWRVRRRWSQLELAGVADVSTRHLSYLETGRASPSREMVLRLADRLDVPLRDRNRLLTAAGYAPMYAERRLDDPALAAARSAV